MVFGFRSLAPLSRNPLNADHLHQQCYQWRFCHIVIENWKAIRKDKQTFDPFCSTADVYFGKTNLPKTSPEFWRYHHLQAACYDIQSLHVGQRRLISLWLSNGIHTVESNMKRPFMEILCLDSKLAGCRIDHCCEVLLFYIFASIIWIVHIKSWVSCLCSREVYDWPGAPSHSLTSSVQLWLAQQKTFLSTSSQFRLERCSPWLSSWHPVSSERTSAMRV